MTARPWRKRILIALLVLMGLAATFALLAHFTGKPFTDPGDCDDGDQLACIRMGARYETGIDGVDVDDAQARHYYQRAYDTKVWPHTTIGAARSLAPYLENGRGGPKDIEGALRLYDFACRHDVERDASFSVECYRAEQLRTRARPSP